MTDESTRDADTVRLLRDCREVLRHDETEARANLPYSQSFLDLLAEVDEHLRLIDGLGRDYRWNRQMSQDADDMRVEQERYRELVRRKDPATMEKRRLVAQCPVCGKDNGHPALSNHWRTHSDGADNAQ